MVARMCGVCRTPGQADKLLRFSRVGDLVVADPHRVVQSRGFNVQLRADCLEKLGLRLVVVDGAVGASAEVGVEGEPKLLSWCLPCSSTKTVGEENRQLVTELPFTLPEAERGESLEELTAELLLNRLAAKQPEGGVDGRQLHAILLVEDKVPVQGRKAWARGFRCDFKKLRFHFVDGFSN